MSLEGKRACVVGAGFGGLALAIRLQAAGVATTLIEARDKPGGRAYFWQRDGFTFDAGPTVITDPASLRALWELTGHAMADDIELMPVSPFYRLNWPDGTSFDYGNDLVELRRQIDHAVVAKRLLWLARLRVEAIELILNRREHSLVPAIFKPRNAAIHSRRSP